VFYERTISIQVHRRSPFSIWDWGQYHAGLPDLHLLQKVLQALLVVGALGAALLPREKSPLQLAALTAALLIGFQIVLTHWSLLYITWFFPFAALALLSGSSLSTGDASRPRR
jgi:CHASE2 domain-containing sensor protein